MDIPALKNQTFTEKNLKGFLLKKVDPRVTDPKLRELNDFLVNRVDDFWDYVVKPLQAQDKFDPNKIEWYFEVYKEGLEARKLREHPFDYITVDVEQIQRLVDFLSPKTMTEYIACGTSFLSSSFSLLSSWMRDILVQRRLDTIYNSPKPSEWILAAEAEEKGAMSDVTIPVDGIPEIMNIIGAIMSQRV